MYVCVYKIVLGDCTRKSLCVLANVFWEKTSLYMRKFSAQHFTEVHKNKHACVCVCVCVIRISIHTSQRTPGVYCRRGTSFHCGLDNTFSMDRYISYIEMVV